MGASLLAVAKSIYYCFPSTTTATTTLLLFSFHHHNHLIFFPPRDSIKDFHLPSVIHFEAMSRVVNNNRGFLQLLADCPAYQRQFLLKTATPQQLHALVQVLYNIPMGHIPISEKISGYCCHIKMLYLTWPVQMSLTKQRTQYTIQIDSRNMLAIYNHGRRIKPGHI